MQKIWFFVEGYSEKNLVTFLIRNKFSDSIQLEKDLLDFVKKDISNAQHHLGYCENCENVDKIPHRINELEHFIEQSKSNLIIIICDVEKLGCVSNRKEKIANILNSDVKKLNIVRAFFNPMIEIGYWECEQIINRVIDLEYRNNLKMSPTDPISPEPDLAHPLTALKKSFKKYNLKYHERSFSEKFFARVDFDTCDNDVLKRIINPLEAICNPN